MAHVHPHPRARPNLPPVPPQLREREPNSNHNPPNLRPIPSNYLAQSAAEQPRSGRRPSAIDHRPQQAALTASNLQFQADAYASNPGPTHAILSGYFPTPTRPAHPSQQISFPTPATSFPSPHHPPLGQAQSTNHHSASVASSPSHRSALNTVIPTPVPSPPLSGSSNRKLSMPLVDLELLTQQYDQYFHVHDPLNQVKWAGKVLKFIERSQADSKPTSSDPNATNTTTTRISDPLLVKYTDIALKTILKHANVAQPVPEALYLRADLSSTGSFPSYKSKDLKMAFRDFEAAANLGYKLAWFRIGREYEAFEDWDRAVGAYEQGMSLGECASIYRLGMSYFLGQLQLPGDVVKAVAHLKTAADLADEDTPQPAYIYGMLLAGEFESLPTIPADVLQPNPVEARQQIEKAAYLGFAAAQYKMGWLYEYSQLSCPFDPLLSVEYYSLASKQGEIEADMALSKWFLCGAEGYFTPNESLAVTFADKAARKHLPSAMFALGYYLEIGIGGTRDIEAAKQWYERAWKEGKNVDAQERLACLAGGGAILSRNEHESNLDQKLVRKHSLAAQRSPYDALKPSGLRRNETMRMVEEARTVVEMGFSGPPSPSTDRGPTLSPPDTGRRRFPASEHGPSRTPAGTPSPNPGRPQLAHKSSHPSMRQAKPGGYQLSDDGPMPASAGERIKPITTITPAGRAQTAQATTTFNSFADMGIQTAKAKKTEDCVIM
ncbi:hypothetical protein CROQUDRAFT_83886 [Cronartium quercuum f. sp. fusiforme G11]|uniref:HCP-like protein n=1 Tax=Cronartium quercuum f. sp. fusiforme G11 TaxID=708437 RepID=A0A9P6T6C1_9BASI|nr:hypothetical protein CROQUDRAFT_83886 [Cronartium quercuum f. sp. fusiforme G11]